MAEVMTQERMAGIKDCLAHAREAHPQSIVGKYARGEILLTHLPALLAEVERLQKEQAERDATVERLTRERDEARDVITRLVGNLTVSMPTSPALLAEANAAIEQARKLVLPDAPAEPQPEPRTYRYEWRETHDGSCFALFDGKQDMEAVACVHPDRGARFSAFRGQSWQPCASIADGKAQILSAKGINPSDVKPAT